MSPDQPLARSPHRLAATGWPLALCGHSTLVRSTRAQLEAAISAQAIVLEAEQGLEAVQVARGIHDAAARSGAFITMDCSADPHLEGELFGVRAGALAPDKVTRESALGRAAHGTLCLLAPRGLTPQAQSRLCDAIRGGLGMATSPGAIAVRIVVCAEPADVASIPRGTRPWDAELSRCSLRVPPLRERPEDIRHIVDRILEEHAGPRVALAPAALSLMCALPWRGNVVELRTLVARLATASSGVVELDDVLRRVRLERSDEDGAGGASPPKDRTLRAAREEFERWYIARIIHRHDGCVSDAARALGLQRTNLYRKARQLGLPVARWRRDNG